MRVPMIGLGTSSLKGKQCTEVIQKAIDLGYQHIDTAHMYENHSAIKQGIENYDRTKLFITSKIYLEDQIDPKNIKNSVEKALENALLELGTDYLDLYLIHIPNRTYPLNEIYRAIVDLKEQGKIAHAGVSNFTIRHLKDLKDAGFSPFANQVEFHPYLNQKALLEYCQSHNITLISYRSFGKGQLLEEEPLFDQIGKKYQKTGAQVILKWLVQKKIPVIPKASSEKHLKENLDINDFTLTKEDLFSIEQLDKGFRYCMADNPEYDYE